MKFFLTAAALTLFTFSAFAMEFAGLGYGATETDAKREALADLASIVKVEVTSNIAVKSEADMNSVDREIKKLITTRTDMPILGVIYSTTPADGETMAKAYITAEKAIPLYKKAMTEILREIEATIAIHKKDYSAYTNLLKLLETYSKYTSVATLLGIKDIKPAPTTQSEVKAQIAKLEKSADTIDIAASILTRGITEKNIRVLPAETVGSHEVTPFASVLRDRVASKLKTGGDYTLRGTYTEGANELTVSYSLSDELGNTIRTNVATLSKNAYKNYRTKPQTISFDKLLHQGLAVSSDFRIETATDKGADNLVFKKGEQIELLVKMNAPGYFYMAGHVAKPDESYSYMVELGEGQGNRKFIYYMNADVVNKWVSLGSFDVAAPFGVESIQTIAVSDDPSANIPPVRYDSKLGLYIIDNSPEKALRQTRALKPAKTKKVKTAEAVMMFTTFED